MLRDQERNRAGVDSEGARARQLRTNIAQSSKTCTAPALQEARHHSPHGKAQGSNTPHRDTEPGSGPTLLRFTREIRMSQKIPTFGHKSGSASSQQQCTSDAITVTRWAMFTYMFSDLASYRGFPASSVGEESACNAGDPSSIPGSGRSPGERIGYPLQYSWASLVAQLVKNPPAMWETWV